MGYAADILAKELPPDGAYSEIRKAFYQKHFPHGEADPDVFWQRIFSLSLGERALMLINELRNEVSDGGFGQYFDNTGYLRPADTVRALDLIGATKSAEYLRTAMAIAKIPDPLPLGYERPPCDSDVEFEEQERVRTALDTLDTEYYRGMDDMTGLMLEYIRAHPEEFT